MTKKPHFNPPRSEERLKKSKWQWFLLFLLVFGAWRPVMAQSGAERITLDLHQATMDAFAQEIKAQAGYTFFYNDSLAKAIEPITLSVKDEPLTSVLDKVLGPKGYTFTIEDKTIVIKKARPLPRGIKSVEVCGFVYDEKRQPMPGVTVQVVGTTVGTASTAGGWFSIDLPLVEGKLKFSFVGYKDKEVAFTAASARDTLRVYMEENVEELDEAIVVAYGETTRRKATGSISVVKAEEIRGIPSVSIETLLQGRVAGLDVTQMSGAPGGGGTAVTIRGYNSLDVEQGRRFSNPLWVVDGVPMNSFTSPITGTNLLSDLNPDMIESIQILKDASSAAIYGSRAANGVIIITTKKGRKNQDATFSVNVSQTWSILPELPTVTTGRAERLFRLEAVKNSYQAYLDPETNRYKYPETLREQYDHNLASLDGNFIPRPYNNNNGTIFQDSLNSFYNNSTNFFPIYYVKGKVTNANIQTYGGSERMTYGIGLGYYNEEGIFRGTGFNRVDLNSSMNVTPVERLNVDLRLNASLSNRKRGTKQGMLNYAPSIETVPGEPYELSSLLPGEGSIAWNSVLDTYKGTKEKNRAVRLRANFKLDYEPIEGLNISTSLAADYSIERRNYFQPSTLSQDGYSISIGETGVNLMVLNENIISFNRVIKDVHSIGVVAGLSYQYDQVEYNGGSAQNSPSDKIYYAPAGMPTLGTQTYGSTVNTIAFQKYQSDMQEKSLWSYFARLEYGYKDKYLLSASIRRDGSSTFGENNRWGTFPSIAAAWTFSEERFIQENLGWLSFGKIRASWGRSGMHFSQNYLALGIMNVGASSYLGNPTIEPQWGDGLYNYDLSWEETDQYDFGLDLDLFDYRLGITLDYYYRYTDKLLATIQLPGSYKGYTMQWRNTAAISNEGIELMVKYEIFRKPDLYWKISVNGARNWNRFEKSYDGKDFDNRIIGKPLNGVYAPKTDGFINSYDELELYYNPSGVGYYLSSGEWNKYYFYKPGDYKFVDVNGDTYADYSDQVYVGSALPEISGGIVNEFRWKNFDLNMLFSYSLGRHMINYTIKRTFNGQMYQALVFDFNDISFWSQPGDNPDYPKWQKDQFVNLWQAVDRDVEKVNYMKLRTLTIGYSLPKHWSKKVGMDELRVFVSGENLLTWTNYSGLDPETADITNGQDTQSNYPLPRKYTLGLTLKF